MYVHTFPLHTAGGPSLSAQLLSAVQVLLQDFPLIYETLSYMYSTIETAFVGIAIHYH